MRNIFRTSLIILLTLCAASLWANPSLTFTAAPSDEGSTASLTAALNLPSLFNPRLRLSYKSSNTIEQLVDWDDNSLLAAKAEYIDGDLSLIQYRIGNTPLKLHGGAGYRRQSIVQQGNFTSTVIQRYKNEFGIDYAGPYIGLEFNPGALAPLPVNIKMEAGIMPVYAYRFYQTITIEPLVSYTGTNEQTASGSPVITAELDLTLFSLVDISTDYQFQRIHLDLLSLSETLNSFSSASKTSDMHDLSMDILARLNLFGSGTVKLGLNITYSRTVDIDPADATEDSTKYAFQMGFELN